MRKKLIFPLLAILLLTPWPVAYAYDNTMARPEPIQIEAAAPSGAPNWSVFEGAIGGVTTPGNLFYIDTTSNSADILGHSSSHQHGRAHPLLQIPDSEGRDLCPDRP